MSRVSDALLSEADVHVHCRTGVCSSSTMQQPTAGPILHSMNNPVNDDTHDITSELCMIDVKDSAESSENNDRIDDDDIALLRLS